MFAELRAHLPIRLDSHHLSVLDDDFLDGLVQHVRPTVDGTQPGITHNTQARCDFMLLTILFIRWVHFSKNVLQLENQPQ